MKRLTIQEIQQVNLDIMKDIHKFCITNDIKYSLAYGSLLGAVRHKGFIPWDDDIDIWMTRPNFERFMSLYKTHDKYRLVSVYDKDCLLGLGRVYETKDTFIEWDSKTCDGDIGVWVDICPIDAIPDDENARKRQYTKVLKLWRHLGGARCDVTVIERNDGIASFFAFVKLCIKNIIRGNYHTIQKNLVTLCKSFPFGTTTNCCYFMCLDAYNRKEQEVLKTADFFDYRLINFEDTQFYIIENYRSVLSEIYGNYMSLPPVDKRIPRHGAEFYWK